MFELKILNCFQISPVDVEYFPLAYMVSKRKKKVYFKKKNKLFSNETFDIVKDLTKNVGIQMLEIFLAVAKVWVRISSLNVKLFFEDIKVEIPGTSCFKVYKIYGCETLDILGD